MKHEPEGRGARLTAHLWDEAMQSIVDNFMDIKGEARRRGHRLPGWRTSRIWCMHSESIQKKDMLEPEQR